MNWVCPWAPSARACFKWHRDTPARQPATEQARGPSESCFLNISNKDSEAPQLEISNGAFSCLPLPHAELIFVTNVLWQHGVTLCVRQPLCFWRIEHLTRRLPRAQCPTPEVQPTQILVIFTTKQFIIFNRKYVPSLVGRSDSVSYLFPPWVLITFLK